MITAEMPLIIAIKMIGKENVSTYQGVLYGVGIPW